MKKILFAIVALFCTTLSFAQEYMVIENIAGGYARYDVDVVKQAYFKTYEASGAGTEENPFNVAAANAKCKEIGSTPSTEQYYVKGYVVSVSRYMNGYINFYMADDSTGINRISALEVRLPGKYELKRGDVVVVYGPLYNYNLLTPEMSGQIIAFNGQKIELPNPQGSGTLVDPFNVQAAIEYVSALEADVQSGQDIYIKGYVTTISSQYDTVYGNATFYISDTKEGDNRFYVYRSLYLDNEKYNEGPLLQEGDEVIICGKVVNYRGSIPETVAGMAYLYSLNGKTTMKPLTIAQVIAGEDGNTYKVRGIVTSITNTTYGNYYLKDETGELLIYGTLDANGQTTNFASLGIEVGDIVTVEGPKKTYNQTPELVNVTVLKIEKNSSTETNLGTLDAPLTVSQALNIINAMNNGGSTEKEAYVAGKISRITTADDKINVYKNINYYISDGTNELYVYCGKNLNNTDFTEPGQINVGDEVVVFGKLHKYANSSGNVTPEFAKGNYIVKLTKGEQGGSGANANKNTSGPTEAQSRYEFPKLKGGNNVVVVHKSILNKDTNEEGVNYSIEWDPSIRSQRWSCYQLYNSVNYKSGSNVSRYYSDNSGSLLPECQYPNDPNLPVEYQFTVDSYKGSGYDHGHICPSADRLRATECNYQTFFITNMQPQNKNFNAGIWADMEAQVRTWANNFDTLYVCKGGTIDNSNYIVNYLGSGNNKIPVPQYFYMAVLGKKESTYKATSFWIDQNNHPSTSIKDYAVTIQELEEKTGIDFFCNMPDDIENSVETVSKSTMESEWNWPN